MSSIVAICITTEQDQDWCSGDLFSSRNKAAKIDFLSPSPAFVLTFVGTFKLNFFTFTDVLIYCRSQNSNTFHKYRNPSRCPGPGQQWCWFCVEIMVNSYKHVLWRETSLDTLTRHLSNWRSKKCLLLTWRLTQHRYKHNRKVCHQCGLLRQQFPATLEWELSLTSHREHPIFPLYHVCWKQIFLCQYSQDTTDLQLHVLI